MKSNGEERIHTHLDRLVICEKCNKHSTWSETARVMEYENKEGLSYSDFRACFSCVDRLNLSRL